MLFTKIVAYLAAVVAAVDLGIAKGETAATRGITRTDPMTGFMASLRILPTLTITETHTITQYNITGTVSARALGHEIRICDFDGNDLLIRDSPDIVSVEYCTCFTSTLTTTSAIVSPTTSADTCTETETETVPPGEVNTTTVPTTTPTSSLSCSTQLSSTSFPASVISSIPTVPLSSTIFSTMTEPSESSTMFSASTVITPLSGSPSATATSGGGGFFGSRVGGEGGSFVGTVCLLVALSALFFLV